MSHQAKSACYFETGVFRPPSEGGSASLLLRLTRNCPWNHCTFCAMYKTEKFQLRTPEAVIGEIDTMHGIYTRIKALSPGHAPGQPVSATAIRNFVQKTPELSFHQGMGMLFEWFMAGCKTVFLQDADSLIMKTDHMIQILNHLKLRFPEIERITTYARSRTVARKPLSDLEAIQKSGLTRLHMGLETGDATLLKSVKKGATPEDHIKAGQKALQAGFQISEYWMPGLGGRSLSRDHAVNTATVLNSINPHYIRSRPFTPYPGTVFYEEAIQNRLDLLTPAEQLQEIQLMVQTLDVTSRVCFDHAGNGWAAPNGRLLLSQGYEGYQFPEEKETLLALIATGIDHYSRE